MAALWSWGESLEPTANKLMIAVISAGMFWVYDQMSESNSSASIFHFVAFVLWSVYFSLASYMVPLEAKLSCCKAEYPWLAIETPDACEGVLPCWIALAVMYVAVAALWLRRALTSGRTSASSAALVKMTTVILVGCVAVVIIFSSSGGKLQEFPLLRMLPLTGSAGAQLSARRHRRSLVALAVGDGHRLFAEQIVNAFGHERFDFMMMHYDNTGTIWSSCSWYNDKRIKKVTEIGANKLELARKHLPPEQTGLYEYLFLWDGDAVMR
jgi:hypothetical protein